MAYQPETLLRVARRINSGSDWRLPAQQLMDDVRRDPSAYRDLVGHTVPPFEDIRLAALFQSLVYFLGRQYQQNLPDWIFPALFLRLPWFPGGIENLKATCLQESPLEFRRNHIFVLKNFLERV